jgi:hypothetical protein
LQGIRIVVQDAIDARSAGFIAAIEQGYYESVGLSVTIVAVEVEAIVRPAPDASGGADLVVAWLPQVLRARDRGETELVDIGQFVQRSGTLSMAYKDAEITSPEDFRDQGSVSSGAVGSPRSRLPRLGRACSRAPTSLSSTPGSRWRRSWLAMSTRPRP